MVNFKGGVCNTAFYMFRPGIHIAFMLFCYSAWGQNNLVPNYSFETFTTCPNPGPGLIHYAYPWFQPNDPQIQPGGSSDFYHTCNAPNLGAPPYSAGYQFPRTGSGMSGMNMFHDTVGPWPDRDREYIETALTDSLVAGREYCVKFYTVKGNWSIWAVQNIQAVLTNDSLVNSDINWGFIPSVTPVVMASAIVYDTLNWQEVSGVYAAAGGEKFITIGNFTPGAQVVHKMVLPYNSSPNTLGYYLVDDVSVYALPDYNAGNDTTINANDTVVLGPSSVRPDVFYSWSPVTGLDNPNIANPQASPGQTTTYTLTVTDTSRWACSATLTSTVTVTVADSVFDPDAVNLFVPDAFSPNGDNLNDVLYVRSRYPLDELEFGIYDRSGREVFRTTDPQRGWDGTYRGKALNSAVFVYYVRAVLRGTTYELRGNVTLVR